MVTIDFIVKRHGEKEKVAGVVSSTPQDRGVSLSDRGLKEELRYGQEHIQPPPYYAHVIGISSEFVRCVQTLNLNLRGAGYDPHDGQRVTTMTRSDIGLGVNNHARSAHPEMPPYGNEPDVLNAYVRTLFEKFWNPRPGNPPCLAAYAAVMLDAIAYGIERAQGLPLPDDAHVLVEIVTHCPVIDAGARVLERVLHVPPERHAMIMLASPGLDDNLANYMLRAHGAFQTGESFSGTYVPDWKREGPYPHAGLHRPIKYDNLTFQIKGEKFAFHWENDPTPPVDRPSVLHTLRSARQHCLEEASILHE